MEAMTAKRRYNLQTWGAIISECKNSGMTIKDWCSENSIQSSRFYYWQKQLRVELSSSLELSQPEHLSTNFVEVKERLTSGSTTKPDMVLAMGEIRLEINNSVSPSILGEVLKVIAHA